MTARVKVNGFQEIIHWFRIPMPDLQMIVEDQIAQDDKVATRAAIGGTHSRDFEGIRVTGKLIVFLGIALDRISGARVVEMWHETAMLGAVRQASLGTGGPERE